MVDFFAMDKGADAPLSFAVHHLHEMIDALHEQYHADEPVEA
jgi:hypothetical protein